MISALVQKLESPVFGIFALVLFISFFLGVLFWTYFVETKKSLAEKSQIPFQDENSQLQETRAL